MITMTNTNDDLFFYVHRWKEEYHMLSDKWEKTVQALRTEVSDKEGRINELSSLLREARDKTIEVS